MRPLPAFEEKRQPGKDGATSSSMWCSHQSGLNIKKVALQKKKKKKKKTAQQHQGTSEGEQHKHGR